jgi:gas vesicle protein
MNNRTNTLGAGFTIGLITGGCAVLLTTPKSGKSFRRDVRVKSDEAQQSFNRFKKDILTLNEQITLTSKQAVPLLKDTANEIKEAVTQWKNDIEPHVNKLQSSISEAQKTTKQLEKITKK